MVIQLSVENAIANKATATKLKIVAKANVTALQKPILSCFQVSVFLNNYYTTLARVITLPKQPL